MGLLKYLYNRGIMKSRRSGARRKRSVKRTRGGVYKGQGSYGCVFNPAIKCADEAARRPGTISKLMAPLEADKDFSQHSALKRIDPRQKYLLWPLRLCEPEYQDPENNSSRCTIAKNAAGTQVNVRSIRPKMVLYTDGGQTLDQVVITQGNIVSLLSGLRNLFRGLVVLHAANMAHLDIKDTNVVALHDPVTGDYNIRFIDFGLTRTVDQMGPQELSDSWIEILTERRNKLDEELRMKTEEIDNLRQSVAAAGNNVSRAQHYTNLLEHNVIKLGEFEQKRLQKITEIEDLREKLQYNHLKIFTNDYPCWPFELRFVYPLYPRTNLRTAILKWYGIKQYGRDTDGIPAWTWYNQDGEPILNTHAGREILGRAAVAPIKNIIQASDIYALGRMTAQMYSRCTGHTWIAPGRVHVSWAAADQLRDQVSTPLYTLLQRMMDPDMFARPTALEAADEYEHIIDELRTLYAHSPVLPNTTVMVGPDVSPTSANMPLYVSPTSSPNMGARMAMRPGVAVQTPRLTFTPPKKQVYVPSLFNARALTVRRLPPLGSQSRRAAPPPALAAEGSLLVGSRVPRSASSPRPSSLNRRPFNFPSPPRHKVIRGLAAAREAMAEGSLPLGSLMHSATAPTGIAPQHLTLLGAKGFNSPGANDSEPAGRSGASSSGPAGSDPRATSGAAISGPRATSGR